jgi:hypothetical protein
MFTDVVKGIHESSSTDKTGRDKGMTSNEKNMKSSKSSKHRNSTCSKQQGLFFFMSETPFS